MTGRFADLPRYPGGADPGPQVRPGRPLVAVAVGGLVLTAVGLAGWVATTLAPAWPLFVAVPGLLAVGAILGGLALLGVLVVGMVAADTRDRT